MIAPGRQIDRYIVEEPIGHGGMATVYRVRHAELGSWYALKVLSVARADLGERLLREGRIQAALQHPNLVRVHDILRVDGHPALVMEWVEGTTLDQWLARGRLPLAEVLELFRGIARGVRHAHAGGLVHRDLKPANVLLARVEGTWVPRVADFGIAKVVAEEGTGTRTGSALGTPRYMAPEQIRNAATVDARADVYALGVILYEMVCGRALAEGTDVIALYADAMAGRRTPIRDLAPDVPDAVIDAVEAALIGDHERRLPSVDALLERLGMVVAAPSQESLNTRVLARGPASEATWGGVDPDATTDRPMLEATEADPLRGYRLVKAIDGEGPVQSWIGRSPEGADVLVKLVRGTADRKTIELYLREVSTLPHVIHPRIAKYVTHFSYGEGEGRRLVLVRAKPSGVPLRDRWPEGRWTQADVVARLTDALQVLIALHSYSPPVIARDLAPERWFLAEDGLHLIDLGAMRDEFADPVLGGATFAGHFGFMAPEQFAGDATPATDVHNAAVLAIALATRKSPHHLLDPQGRLIYRPFAQLDGPLMDLLDAMLAPDPHQRPTAVDAWQRLQRPPIAAAKPADPRPARDDARGNPADLPEEPVYKEALRDPVGGPVTDALVPELAKPSQPLVIPPPPFEKAFGKRRRKRSGIWGFVIAAIVLGSVFHKQLNAVSDHYFPRPPPIAGARDVDDQLEQLARTLEQDPDVQQCLLDAGRARPDPLASRLDVELIARTDEPVELRIPGGPYVNTPLASCIVDAVAADLPEIETNRLVSHKAHFRVP